MDEVSAQTDTAKETLQDLRCTNLVEKIDIPEDYIVLQDENAVLITHCSLPAKGNSALQQNQLCYERIKDFLGIEPITRCIMETLTFEGDALELISEYVPRGAAGCLMIHSVVDGKKKGCQDLEQELQKPDSCSPHEPTHLFVAGTVLHNDPPWLNEGLAEYVMAALQDNVSLECFSDGFSYIFRNPSTGEVREAKEGKYVPMDRSRKKHKEAGTSFDAYLTGACLWNHLDRQYGHETFMAIMQDVEDSRLSSISFVDSILSPRIGKTGISDLEQRFGKDSIDAFR